MKLGHLKYFYFANNQLGNVPDMFPKSWRNLLHLSLSIELVNVANNKMTVDGLPDLQQLFPKLTYLSLSKLVVMKN